MEFLGVIIFLAAFLNFSHSHTHPAGDSHSHAAAITLRPISSLYLPYAYGRDGITGQYGIDKDALEQSAYDYSTGLVYAAGSSFIHIIDYNNVTDPVILKVVPTSVPINDIELCGDLVAFSVQGATVSQPGQIHVYNVYDNVTGMFEMAHQPLNVGYTPDMLQFTKDCKTIVVANEGEGYRFSPTEIVDPEGAVSIIKFQQGARPPPPVVTTVDFTAFNMRSEGYESRGVRWPYRGELSRQWNTFSQSLEPEYVTINEDDTKAYICLQENNAIAEVDLMSMQITEVYPLGVKEWKNLVLDASDKDSGINLQKYDIRSFREPDSIYHFDYNGIGYIVTSNEGETIDYGDGGVQAWSDSKRGRQLVEEGYLAADVPADVRAALADDTRLGRLEFSVVDGLSRAAPGNISRPHFHGGRGISIFRASDMSLIWDSGDMISKLHAEHYPKTFNGNTKPKNPARETPEDLMDDRSDNQGPECEALTMGTLEDGTRLLFVGVGRSSTVMIFRFAKGSAQPRLEFESMFRAGSTNANFRVLLQNRDVGNYDPEDLKFIPASNSSTGKPMLLVTGTTSGSLVMYEVGTGNNSTGRTPGSGANGVYGHPALICSTLIALGLILAGNWQ